mmetsp:Transcript_16838/g.25320  ORF Transcript_16838/g.25320 Transcript_16838/m.25320 type:complete len:136 (-) Transcript_16838:125-532(-)
MSQERYVYVIHCLDDLSCGMVEKGSRFGGSAKRIENYAEHKKYQVETANPESPNFIRKLSAGPLESEDGKYMIGSMIMVYGTREEVDTFYKNDPFYKENVWGQINVTRYVSPTGIKAAHAVKDGDDLSTLRMDPI